MTLRDRLAGVVPDLVHGGGAVRRVNGERTRQRGRRGLRTLKGPGLTATCISFRCGGAWLSIAGGIALNRRPFVMAGWGREPFAIEVYTAGRVWCQ